MVMMSSQTFFSLFSKKTCKFQKIYISLQRSFCRNTGGADIGILLAGCPSMINAEFTSQTPL